MTTAVQPGGGGGGGGIERPTASSLADVIDTILDKGLVLDAYVRVSLVGIEILTIDARVVLASVDTYLRFADAVNRLDLKADKDPVLPEIVDGMQERGASGKQKGGAQGALEAAADKFREVVGNSDQDAEPAPRRGRRQEKES